jgi:ParB family chromosome partitioning protein
MRPFDREDPTLNPAAGTCSACPRRSGYNTSLFCDVQGDQCLDGNCYQTKLTAHIDRAIAATPALIQIENSWRSKLQQRPGAVQRGHYLEIADFVDNPDAEPAPPCEAAKPAIVVYGRGVGTTLTVCTDDDCPVHHAAAPARQTVTPVTASDPAAIQETNEELEERKGRFQAQQQECQDEQERRQKERDRQQQKYEAERARKEQLRQERQSKLECILNNAPIVFNGAHSRAFLRFLLNIDPYRFLDDVAHFFATDEDYSNEREAQEVVLSTLDGLADEKLTGFALRLVLTAHTDVPPEGISDFLAEAEVVFAPPVNKTAVKKEKKPALVKTQTPKKSAKKTSVA